MSEDTTAWKAIAMQLAQRVNFAVSNLKASGSGVIGDMNKPSSEWQHWRHYLADGLEMIPGMKVDREMLNTMELPSSRRAKAQTEIIKRRKSIEGAQQ
jgi:hypothetical protein